MLQPNCSEIVFWLANYNKEQILKLLDDVIGGFPVIDTTRENNQEADNYLRFYNIFTSTEQRDKADGLIKANQAKKYWQALFENAINSATLSFKKGDRTLVYKQDSQPEGFPLLLKLHEKTGVQPEGYNEGSLADYVKWKREQGLPLTDEEKAYQ